MRETGCKPYNEFANLNQDGPFIFKCLSSVFMKSLDHFPIIFAVEHRTFLGGIIWIERFKEDERIAKGPSGNHQSITTSLLKTFRDSVRMMKVTVADQRNCL